MLCFHVVLLLEANLLKQQLNSTCTIARATPKLEIRRNFKTIKRLQLLKNQSGWRTRGRKPWDIQDKVGDFLQVGFSRDENFQMIEPLRKTRAHSI